MAKATEEPSPELVAAIQDADLRAIFERFDLDNSGSLDMEELKQACLAAGLPADDETIRMTMEALDTDGDGVVSVEEFKAAPKEVAWWEGDASLAAGSPKPFGW